MYLAILIKFEIEFEFEKKKKPYMELWPVSIN